MGPSLFDVTNKWPCGCPVWWTWRIDPNAERPISVEYHQDDCDEFDRWVAEVRAARERKISGQDTDTDVMNIPTKNGSVDKE